MCIDRNDADNGTLRINRSYMLALRLREKPEERSESSSDEGEQPKAKK